MRITLAVILGFLLDARLGDPQNVWHPVCAIGSLIVRLEKILRRLFPSTVTGENTAGVLLWLVTCSVSYFIPFFVLRCLYGIHQWLGFAAEIVMCYQIFARKSLADAGKQVQNALAVSLEAGRNTIAQYVGRDTSALTQEEIIRAAVETVAENLNDGVIAPLCYLLLGGAPLGFFYKAVNTLDSMVGYHTKQYEYLGKCAARMDDIFGWVPARLSAVCLMAAAGLSGMDCRNAWRIFRRDRNRHKSPNAGQTEAACAGALHVQLGGDASYFGQIVPKATLGDPDRSITIQDISRACRLMLTASALALLAGCMIRVCLTGPVW